MLDPHLTTLMVVARHGSLTRAAAELHQFANGAVDATVVKANATTLMAPRQFFANRQMWLLIIGTAGSWFLFDYAYYGNTLSLPSILLEVSPTATIKVKLLLTLAMFVVFALPGYILAVTKIDRIGHRRLQSIGFSVMAACFLLLAAVPRFTTMVVPFVLIFGFSYLFTEFGPNTTTFVLPGEVFPTSVRTTGHGISAGFAKVGAFIGVYLFPIIKNDLGISGALRLSAGFAFLGMLVTLLIPEGARRSLDDISPEELVASAEQIVASGQVEPEEAAAS